MTTLDADAPARTYLEMLQAELADYLAKRAAAIDKLAEDQPEYLAQVLKMWEHTIGQQIAKIAKEEAQGV